jgi:hypothetical protein
MNVKRSEVTRRELLLLALGSVALAVVMTWPLVLHLGDTVPRDLGDPLPQAWQVAWDGHALLHQPLHFFQANQYWPFRDTLAFSDALIGYTPAGLIGSGPHAALVRYDLLFIFAYALAFAGAYLLARELGLSPLGATVAGAAFAFAPFRLEQDGHMQVISSGGIPLALALGIRGYRLRSPASMVAGWLVAAWQVSLGFTLGLPFAYALAALFAVLAILWWRDGRPALERRMVIATIAGASVFLVVTALLSVPYQRVASDHPEAKRSPATVAAYSGEPREFLMAPEENFVWAGATSGLRDGVANVPEKTLFPGLVILGLALAGLGWRGWSRRLRWGLAGAVLVSAVLALGFKEEGGLLWPYRVVYDLFPGWQGIRTPGRLTTFTSLALALLAAAGTMRLLATERLRGHARAAATVAALLALAVVIEGRGLPFDPTDSQAQPHAPAVPPSTADVAAPQLHLPAQRPEDNRRYVLWSTDGFAKIVNGRSSTIPPATNELISDMADFPNQATVAELRDRGIASVVVHLDRIHGTPQDGIAQRPLSGLGLTVRRDGPLLFSDLGSAGGVATSEPHGGDGDGGQ